MDSAVSPLEAARRVLMAPADLDALSLPVPELNSEEAIVKAFKRTALQLHPDRHVDLAPTDLAIMRSAFQRATDARDRLLARQRQRCPPAQTRITVVMCAPQSPESAARATCTPHRTAPDTFPCVHQACTNETDVPGTECRVCLFKRDVRAGTATTCSRFGCLRPLRSRTEAESGVCSYCLSAPHKCKSFGCLISVSDGQAFCPQHREDGNGKDSFSL